MKTSAYVKPISERYPATGFLRLSPLWVWMEKPLNVLQPLASLLARVYVGNVFFSSGLTKLRDWDTTLLLFREDYKVPLLPPTLAAYMGTAGEIGLPVLLVLGLGGRFSAMGLSVVNLVAVFSLSEIAPAALQQHITWGVLLATLALFGCGHWSADTIWGLLARQSSARCRP
jgi:putative oxidoreductase